MSRILSRNDLNIVLETVRDLTSMLSTTKIIERLLERILTHLDSETGSVLVLGKDDLLRIMVARGIPDEVVANTVVKMGEGISGFVAKTGQPLLVENIERDNRFKRRNNERYYTRSFLSAPLTMGGKTYGVLNVNNKRDRSRFDPGDLGLLEAIAGHAAVALDAARRYEEAVEQAQRDPLTGLANHRYFWDLLETEIGRAKRYGRVLSVVMVDVDHFKNYNDTYGHLAGDAALEAVAQTMKLACRASDVAGRYGGEEFTLMLPETGLGGALVLAEKLRVAIENTTVANDAHAGVTASLGVATFPDDGMTATELMRMADSRLYMGKAAGRNCVVAAA